MNFEEWLAKEPLGEFEGINPGHVKRAWEAGAKEEREATLLEVIDICARKPHLSAGDIEAEVDDLRREFEATNR